jgi:CBS domain-containing protein
MTTTRLLLDLTAADLLSCEVVTIHRKTPMPAAADLLRRADVTGAPVVDDLGRCVGVLSAVDFLRWAAEEGCGARRHLNPACPYQTTGRLLTGEEAVICTLGVGSCPIQSVQPMTGGRHTPVCLLPHDVVADWQQVPPPASASAGDYMTKDVVFVKPETSVTDLARRMIDAHIHRAVIADEAGKPVGIVSATDVLAAVAREEADAARRRAL